LFETLNSYQSTPSWQHAVLQAFQTWAVNANINIAFRSDGGQAFGISGAAQHDSRFGDIRIGAQPMASDALSISVPNDPAVSSTLSGDVLVNSTSRFDKLDIQAVMLHEAGHVFGIDELNDPNSPMFSTYKGITKLSATDIAAIQGLYGVRAADRNEGSSGNDSFSKATTIQAPGGWTGSTPMVIWGDITTNKDIDVYAIRSLSNYRGSITARVQSAGLSLLAPALTIVDSRGRVVGSAQAQSGMGDTISVQIPNADPSANYFLVVQGATRDVFGIGGYGVAVTLDGLSQTTPSQIDSVLRGPYQTLSSNDVNSLFVPTSNTLLNNTKGSDSSIGTATTILPTAGYAKNTHYEVLGSIATPSDGHFYRFQTANTPSNGKPLVLTVTVRALAINGAAPRLSLVDSDGLTVPYKILANGNGVFTIQIAGVTGGGWYYLNVGPATAAGSAATGNFALVAQFGTAEAQLNSFVSGTDLASGSTQYSTMYVGQSQLINFLLSANSTSTPSTGGAVKMTILDQNGAIVYSLCSKAGDVVSGSAVFLTPGKYTVLFTTSSSQTGSASSPFTYELTGNAISDPIGPVLTDPTLTPIYQAPSMPGWFQYPGTSPMTIAYFFFPAITL
jgi:hypothetical protein